MRIPVFDIEMWMTDHELDCQYNMTETCMAPMTLKELQSLTNIDLMDNILSIKMDYGPITGSDRLKKNILSLYQTGTLDNIVLTQGAINANELIILELLEPKDHVITFYPTYQQLYDLPKSIGCEVSFVELKESNQWQPDFNELKSKIQKNTKMILLNSPNNPTGTHLSESFIHNVIDLCKQNDIYLIVDEIYRGINEIGTYSKSVSDYDDTVIVTGGLSKVFSFAGVRIGWIKAPKEIIQRVIYRRDYHIISNGPLNDYLGCIILENKDKILDRNNEICNGNKQFLREWLKDHPRFSCVIPSVGTVGYLRYDYDVPSAEFAETLQNETGVFFVPGSCFGQENHLRIGFTHSYEEFSEGLNILSEWVKKL